MILRQFNDEGIKCFRNELKICRDNPQASSVDMRLLTDDALTEKIPGNIDVAEQIFKTKGEAGQYLHMLLAHTKLPHDSISCKKCIGLWTWLSLFFFDSVCPQLPQGQRKVNEVHYYIYDQRCNYYYRHLLFVSWKVWDITQGHHRLITSTKINEIDRVTRFIMNKLFIIRIPCIFEVLDSVYWDDTTQKARKNITGSVVRRGDLSNRFPRVIRQLEKTYDLQSLDTKQLIDLLGEEFDFSSP
jgi:hypothetical protein